MPTNELLMDLYACPLNAERWPQTLDQICRETGARSCVLQVLRADERGRLHTQWQAISSHSQSAHRGYEIRIGDGGNARLSLDRARRAIGKVVRDEDLFDADDPNRLQLQSQLQALGLGRFMGVMERRQDGGFVALALHRAAGDGRDFGARDVAVMAALAPHLVQADQLRGRVAAGPQPGADTLTPQPWQVLNSLPLGLLVCRADGQVLAINRSAEHALRTSPWLSLQDGRLAAQGAQQQAQLLGCLRRVAEHAEASVLALGSGAHRLHLAAQRTPGSPHEPHLTVFISQAGAGAAVPTAVLAQLFGLTGAEASLLSAIVDGLLPTEYAERRGVSVGTVRGQLKQVLAKTGASRQADLVRLVLSSAVAQLTGVH